MEASRRSDDTLRRPDQGDDNGVQPDQKGGIHVTQAYLRLHVRRAGGAGPSWAGAGATRRKLERRLSVRARAVAVPVAGGNDVDHTVRIDARTQASGCRD